MGHRVGVTVVVLCMVKAPFWYWYLVVDELKARTVPAR
jgi:hypothetical protein